MRLVCVDLSPAVGLLVRIHGSESHDSCVSLYLIIQTVKSLLRVLVVPFFFTDGCVFIRVRDGDKERERQTDTFRNSGSADVFHFSSPACVLLHAGSINLCYATLVINNGI